MNILSIQSDVVYGHVGNAAARFALQRGGHEVWAVLTVLLSSHAGSAKVGGEALRGGRAFCRRRERQGDQRREQGEDEAEGGAAGVCVHERALRGREEGRGPGCSIRRRGKAPAGRDAR